MLRIGDKVVIAVEKCHKPAIADAHRGTIVDVKWNMACVQFSDGTTDWIELKRVYHAT